MVVEGYYEVGMQDQAPLGTESGLAAPDGQGGVDLHIATQWTHVDRDQIVAGLGVEEHMVRVHHAGVGGAFGAREDVSLQIHLCLLALYTGRPVKMEYSRAESFVGHVHRHPAQLWMRHEADLDGTLRRIEARVIIDGGAYRSTSDSVVGNAVYHAAGPYRCDSVAVDGVAVQDQQPPVRGDARLRRGPGLLRSRGADGQTGRRPGHGPGRTQDQERRWAGATRSPRPAR